MFGLFRKIVPLAILGAAGLSVPTPAAAVPCTNAYQRCLNDSWDKSGFAEYLANLECGARYAGCIRAAILR